MSFRSAGLLIFILVLLLSPGARARRVQTSAVAASPAAIFAGVDIIIGSDTLTVRDFILRRDLDYRWDQITRSFLIASDSVHAGDTIRVVFTQAPSWSRASAGREIPNIASTGGTPLPPPSDITISPGQAGFSQNIKLSGAKTFRFSALNGGATEFGQSIDLRIAGELSPGVELSGALSDRGYDPIYGTANSRLNELDKVNLQLKSRRVLVRMGDITLHSDMVPRATSISGAMFQLEYPTWRVQAAAARPRGRFNSIKLSGENGYQGPYQIAGSSGLQAVVPGSETVWLDGKKLNRGADKDYSIDYPSGLITFSPAAPVDRRSRIEIDFEPAESSYRQQLLVAGGGINRADSSVYVSVAAIRQGDDRNQPLASALTDSDRVLLQGAGDSDVYRSGVVADSLGSYVLVTDSLPDTVYQFVGVHQGRYSLTFTYVGGARGRYNFLGTGQYQFVGAGRGDYLPVVILPRPERTDYYQGLIGLRSHCLGNITADVRQTYFDRNLWAASPGSSHPGSYYDLQWTRSWRAFGKESDLTVRRRFLQPEFHFQNRIDQPDFSRDFFLPLQFVATGDQTLTSVGSNFAFSNWGTISPFYSDLSFRNSFQSHTGGVSISLAPDSRVGWRSSWKEIKGELSQDSATRTALADNLQTAVSYAITSRYSAQAQLEYDRRRNDYSGSLGGTRYLRWSGGVNSATEKLQFENYREDSLTSIWAESGLRRRLSLESSRRIDRLSYNATATWQWLKEPTSTQRSFLGRTSFSFTDPASQTQVTTSYALSNELRNARGVTYLLVDQGRGTYSLVNGQYVPDPDGNYVQIEELLSDRERVRRGEKSFLLSKAGKHYSVRFDAGIDEELLDTGRRTLIWLIPFYSDSRQPYLYLQRRYNSDIRLFPFAGVYALNLSISDDLERRNIAGEDRDRRDSRGSLALRQVSGSYYFDETTELFRSQRDDYYSGSGNIKGYKLGGNIRRSAAVTEYSGGLAYRRATSDQDERADTYSVLTGARLRVAGRGEARLSLELYAQKLKVTSQDYSYQLTDNRYGSRGTLWTTSYNYAVKANVKINITINGRHSNDRAGRVAGRAEVVAGF